MNDDSPEIQDITENLTSLQGLLEHNKLTEAQLMLFESIEKSVNNKNTKNIDNKIKTPFSKNEVKNSINIINKKQYNKTHSKNEINNKNTIDDNKNDIIINKTSTIDNNIIINNKKDKIHYNEITHGKNFIHDDENTMINKDFKILRENFTTVLKDNLAKNCFYKSDTTESDYINDIAISIDATKNNWDKTILPCSEEQENDVEILRLMHNELGFLFDSILMPESSYNRILYSSIINTIYNNDMLTSEIYYYLLRKLNNDMFHNKDFTSNMITNVIKNIQKNTIKTPQTYRLILKWLLYCSINKVISCFPQEEINNISSDDNAIEFVYLHVLNRNPNLSKIFNTAELADYNKYIKITNIILNYIIQSLSEEAFIESIDKRNELILQDFKENLGVSNEIFKMFNLIKKSNVVEENSIRNVIRNNKTIQRAFSYIPKISNENLDIKRVIMKRIYNINKLIMQYSYDILLNKHYNKFNYYKKKKINDIDKIINIHTFAYLRKYISYQKTRNCTTNFDIPKKFRIAFKDFFKGNIDLRDYKKSGIMFYAKHKELLNDWKKVIKKNDFNNTVMCGIRNDSQQKMFDSFGIKSKYNVMNILLMADNSVKTEEMELSKDVLIRK